MRWRSEASFLFISFGTGSHESKKKKSRRRRKCKISMVNLSNNSAASQEHFCLELYKFCFSPWASILSAIHLHLIPSLLRTWHSPSCHALVVQVWSTLTRQAGKHFMDAGDVPTVPFNSAQLKRPMWVLWPGVRMMERRDSFTPQAVVFPHQSRKPPHPQFLTAGVFYGVVIGSLMNPKP